MGAQHVHVVDLDAARHGNQPNRHIIVQLAALRSVRLQVGGGLRTLQRVREFLDAGVERAVIGSMAVTAPDEVAYWMTQVDPQRIVLAFDVQLGSNNVPLLATHGWQKTSNVVLWDAVEKFMCSGLRHVLCTDVGRDGAMTGPNCELYAEAVRRFPELRWQASGGIANANDLAQLRDCGVAAAISGKAMLEHTISAEELPSFLRNASSPVSM